MIVIFFKDIYFVVTGSIIFSKLDLVIYLYERKRNILKYWRFKRVQQVLQLWSKRISHLKPQECPLVFLYCLPLNINLFIHYRIDITHTGNSKHVYFST